MPDGPEDRRALYLRWRPTAFADVVGQEHVVRTIRNAVVAGTPGHAYLFAGPRGTGKTSVARILYRAVNCASPRGGDPCGDCDSCRAALGGRSLDLVEIDAASNRGIDDIRDLREKVAFSPSEARYRVYIVDEAHELTAPAWDAFLKTLEEPPPHAIFVLATTEAHKVPGTIVSRCQRFDFRKIRPDSIRTRLLEIASEEGLALAPAAADRLARMARGGLRDAISLLDQAASFTAGQVDLDALREVLGLSDSRAIEQLLDAVAAGDIAATLRQVIELSDSGADLRLVADDLAGHLRGLLFARAGAGRALSRDFSADELAWLEAAAPRWDGAVLQTLLRSIVDGLARIRDGAQLQLHLELALLQACGPAPASAPLVEAVRAAPAAAVAIPAVAPSAPVSNGVAATHLEPPPTLAPLAPSPASEPPPAPRADATVSGVPDPVYGHDGEEPGGESAAPAAAESGPASSGDLESIRAAWPRVVEWVRNRNPFVATYLQPAELRDVTDDDWLVLGFAFKVHYDRMADAKNRTLVEQACQHALGRALKLRCQHTSAKAPASDQELDLDEPVLKFALEKFGGRAEWADQ